MPQIAENLLDQVIFSHRDSTAGDNRVGVRCGLTENRAEQSGIVGHYSEIEHIDPQFGENRGQHRPVRIVDATRAERRRVRRRQFVTGGEHGHHRPPHHYRFAHADRRQQPEMHRVEPGTGAQNGAALLDVASGASNVISRRRRCQQGHMPVLRALRILNDHHRIGAVGHRSTGHDLDSSPWSHRRLGNAARRHILQHHQRHRRRHHVCGPHRKAVHGRVGKGWHGMWRHDLFGQNQTETLIKRGRGRRQSLHRAENIALRIG